MSSLKVYQINDHVCKAVIDRPQAHNALDFEIIDQLETLAEELEERSEVRLFILTGAGDQTFIAGGDLKKFHRIKSAEEAREMSERVQDLFIRFESLPCYTLALLNGNAFGGGIELMLSFDFRLAAPHAKLGFTQGRFFLTPGWGGLTRLTENVGRSKALELQGKARIIDSKEALKLGLINGLLQTDDHEQEVLEWAKPLLRNDRTFIGTLKKNSGLTDSRRIEALKAEIIPFSELWAHPEHIRRVEEFSRK